MTPPRPPVRDPRPTPDNLRPLRPATILDVTGKLDALAGDMRQHEIAERDHRDLLGRQHVEIRALREMALEHGERLERAEQAILAEVVPLARTVGAAKSEASQARAIAARVSTDVATLRRLVGDPPRDPQQLARESQRDMTREEIEALEAGSGLLGDVARLRIHVDHLWRRARWVVGVGAVAASLSPHVPEIVGAIARAIGG